jgi:DNA-binding NtrC family response regulator
VELKGNVSDLRRDLNGIRKQLNDARDIDTAAAYTITTSETPAITPMPAAGSRHEKIEEAEAEEISEPETLNLGNMERQMLMKALERNGGNRKKAARELGISDRTLYRRIKEYGLE